MRFLAGFWFAVVVGSCPVATDGQVLGHWSTNQVCTNRFDLQFIVRGPDRFVGYGWYSDYGVLLLSYDGINWYQTLDGGPPSPTDYGYALALVYTGGKYFAFGALGASAWSIDGTAWNPFYIPAAKGAAYGNGAYAVVINDPYAAIGSSGFDVWTSTNLYSSWTSHNLNKTMGDIAFGSGRFVAIGIGANSGHIYISGAGNIWQERTIPGGTSISFLNGLFIVPFGAGTNLVSQDGLNWAMLSSGISLPLGKVSYANGLFMALAQPYRGASTNYLATSSDGTNWWQYSSPLPGDGYSFATDGFRILTGGGIPTSEVVYFDGFVYRSDPLVSLAIKTNPAQVLLSGLVGRSYQIQSVDALTNSRNTNWQTRFQGPLPNDPFVWTDPTASDSPQRFYRAALLQ